MILRLFTLTCAFLIAVNCNADPRASSEQKVAVLHHIHDSSGADKGWKELDLSKVPRDPNEEEYGPGFQKNIRKTFPFLPKEIFSKR